MRDPSYIPRPTRRPDGRALLRLNGIDHYLGQAGEWPKGRKSPPPGIQAEYQGLIAAWLANGRTLPDAGSCLTVNEVVLAYDTWAETYCGGPASVAGPGIPGMTHDERGPRHHPRRRGQDNNGVLRAYWHLANERNSCQAAGTRVTERERSGKRAVRNNALTRAMRR